MKKFTMAELNRRLMKMSKDEVRDALEEERDTYNRRSYVLRIHNRYNKLRYQAERAVLIAETLERKQGMRAQLVDHTKKPKGKKA
jgi:chromosome segregation and condensation protein ScpB